MKYHHSHRRAQPDAGEAADWFAGRLPDSWFDGDPEVTVDREEITVIGRLPVADDDEPKARASGLRALAETGVVSKALTTLKGRARVKRTMWSRRAQEYEAKINSGDLISIAEVVRDLHRAENQPEQSYSERQLYESALDRMAREVAAIEQIDRDAAIAMLNKSLVKQVAAAADAAAA